MEGISNSMISSSRRNALFQTGVAYDSYSSEKNIPTSLREALNFVSGHASLDRHPSLPCYGEKLTCYPKKLEDRLRARCNDAKENPILVEDYLDENRVTPFAGNSKSFLGPLIADKQDRSYVEKKSDLVNKRHKLNESFTTLLQTQTKVESREENTDSDIMHSEWLDQFMLPRVPKYRDINDLNIVELLPTSNTAYSTTTLSVGDKFGNGYLNMNSQAAGFRKQNTYSQPISYKNISPCHRRSLKTHVDLIKSDSVDASEHIINKLAVDDHNISDISCSTFSNSSSSDERCISSSNESLTSDNSINSSNNDDAQPCDKSDPEREWCISVLQESGLLSWNAEKRVAAAHPGVVGDGSSMRVCKLCGSSEDSTQTLICDSCEEIFHMSCCNPKVKKVPVNEDWFCYHCKKIKKRLAKKSIIQTEDNEVHTLSYKDRRDMVSSMLNENEHYVSPARIGDRFQADVPDCTSRSSKVISDAESSFLGQILDCNTLELECKKEASKGWHSAPLFSSGMKENWLQCYNVIETRVSADGQMVKDMKCGKWRRAPLTELQTENWDCSCAVTWDPIHADCAVPQELTTKEVISRLKASQQVNLHTGNKKRKLKLSSVLLKG